MSLAEILAIVVALSSLVSGLRFIGYFYAVDFRLIGLLSPQDIAISSLWTAPLIIVPSFATYVAREFRDKDRSSKGEDLYSAKDQEGWNILVIIASFIALAAVLQFLFSGRIAPLAIASLSISSVAYYYIFALTPLRRVPHRYEAVVLLSALTTSFAYGVVEGEASYSKVSPTHEIHTAENITGIVLSKTIQNYIIAIDNGHAIAVNLSNVLVIKRLEPHQNSPILDLSEIKMLLENLLLSEYN